VEGEVYIPPLVEFPFPTTLQQVDEIWTKSAAGLSEFPKAACYSLVGPPLDSLAKKELCVPQEPYPFLAEVGPYSVDPLCPTRISKADMTSVKSAAVSSTLVDFF
jgi:hypothetical protein